MNFRKSIPSPTLPEGAAQFATSGIVQHSREIVPFEWPKLRSRRNLIALGVCSLFLLSQQGCAAMSSNYSATNPLRFKEHAMVVQKYNASNMQVIYGRRTVFRSLIGGIGRPEVVREKTPADEDRDQTGSGEIGLRAFEGPLQVTWTSMDSQEHLIVLNLEEIFKDRLVLHREDPARIDPSLPMISYGPTIVIEVNDRTLRVYMDVHIYLRPVGANSQIRGDSRNRTLAYSKTF